MKITTLMLVVFLLFEAAAVFPISVESQFPGQGSVNQTDALRVQNLNTGRKYSTIGEAINAPETLNGHEIFVASGTYFEEVTVNKSISLVGEDRSRTIIDATGHTNALYIVEDNVTVSDFTLQNGVFGIWVDRSNNSRITGNTLQDGSYGIRLYHSRNSIVTDNIVQRYKFFGIELDSSGNTTLRNNSMVQNKYSFGVDGSSLSDFINDIDVSNTVDGKPVRYLMNQNDRTIDSATLQEVGYLGLINSTHVTVQNLNVQGNIQGVLYAYTRNSVINNVNARSNWNGIYVVHSSNILVSENNANNNFDYGIKFFNSSRSLASQNNVDNNGWAGIGLFGSPNSTLDGNEANFNTYNLHIVYTNNSIIRGNTATSKPGGYSVAMYYSHNNIIYHNTLDTSLLYVESRNMTRFTPTNRWDNGLEGNYWSSYRGFDADQDGLGDTSFIVGENNVDNYPLMGNYLDFPVASGGKIYSITLISNSTISQFQFSPEDRKVSFVASGLNGTWGFSRIAVPNALLQDLSGGNLSFLINGEQVPLKRQWTDGAQTYWYFSYVNTVLEWAISPWLIIAAISTFLLVFMLALIVLRRKKH